MTDLLSAKESGMHKKKHDEIWDVYDVEGVRTGKTVRRGDCLERGEYHIVVHILPSNGGKYLVQKRSRAKDTHPLIWAVTGGSAVAGEDSLQAAVRETYEELRITVHPEEFTRICRLVRGESLADIWIFKCDLPISAIDFNREEVEALKWVAYQEILEMVQEGTFYDYGREYLSVLAGLKG
jgi:8-oxo-dGTP pyrophosphatase MutT (NUDIX family)